MKKLLIALALLIGLILAGACRATEVYEPQNGDIVFQVSRSRQSRAIQLATDSPYSHMGIVYLRNGEPVVFEAVEPVKTTPLPEWTARGTNGHVVVKRLRNADQLLDSSAIHRMLETGRTFNGKHYDLRFEWSDDRIYCSELVWKIYQRGLGIELSELETVADFNLDQPEIQAVVSARWDGAPPPEQKIVSPAAIFNSELLVTVFEN